MSLLSLRVVQLDRLNKRRIAPPSMFNQSAVRMYEYPHNEPSHCMFRSVTWSATGIGGPQWLDGDARPTWCCAAGSGDLPGFLGKLQSLGDPVCSRGFCFGIAAREAGYEGEATRVLCQKLPSLIRISTCILSDSEQFSVLGVRIIRNLQPACRHRPHLDGRRPRTRAHWCSRRSDPPTLRILHGTSRMERSWKRESIACGYTQCIRETWQISSWPDRGRQSGHRSIYKQVIT